MIWKSNENIYVFTIEHIKHVKINTNKLYLKKSSFWIWWPPQVMMCLFQCFFCLLSLFLKFIRVIFISVLYFIFSLYLFCTFSKCLYQYLLNFPVIFCPAPYTCSLLSLVQLSLLTSSVLTYKVSHILLLNHFMRSPQKVLHLWVHDLLQNKTPHL